MNGEQLANAMWHGDDPNAAAVWCDDCLAAGQPNPACMNLGMAKADRNLPLSVGMDNLMPILCQLCQQHIARAEAGRPPAFAYEGVRILICGLRREGARRRRADERVRALPQRTLLQRRVPAQGVARPQALLPHGRRLSLVQFLAKS